jgi:hypothetical protein
VKRIEQMGRAELEIRVRELETAIRQHRDHRNDDQLYAVLAEPNTNDLAPSAIEGVRKESP